MHWRATSIVAYNSVCVEPLEATLQVQQETIQRIFSVHSVFASRQGVFRMNCGSVTLPIQILAARAFVASTVSHHALIRRKGSISIGIHMKQKVLSSVAESIGGGNRIL